MGGTKTCNLHGTWLPQLVTWGVGQKLNKIKTNLKKLTRAVLIHTLTKAKHHLIDVFSFLKIKTTCLILGFKLNKKKDFQVFNLLKLLVRHIPSGNPNKVIFPLQLQKWVWDMFGAFTLDTWHGCRYLKTETCTLHSSLQLYRFKQEHLKQMLVCSPNFSSHDAHCHSTITFVSKKQWPAVPLIMFNIVHIFVYEDPSMSVLYWQCYSCIIQTFS